MNPHPSIHLRANQHTPALFRHEEPVEATQERTLSKGRPSKPLFGALPLARVIPQDVHSIMDYANGAITGLGVTSDDNAAKLASAVLGASVIGVSLVTDYRLSVAKILPIEAHEVADYGWGMTAIALPFVLGYWKRSPMVAMSHIIAGAGTILSALITDYRAYRKRAA